MVDTIDDLGQEFDPVIRCNRSVPGYSCHWWSFFCKWVPVQQDVDQNSLQFSLKTWKVIDWLCHSLLVQQLWLLLHWVHWQHVASLKGRWTLKLMGKQGSEKGEKCWYALCIELYPSQPIYMFNIISCFHGELTFLFAKFGVFSILLLYIYYIFAFFFFFKLCSCRLGANNNIEIEK